MSFLRKLFSNDAGEEHDSDEEHDSGEEPDSDEEQKQILRKLKSIGKTIDSFNKCHNYRSIIFDAYKSQKGRELAIGMLSIFVKRHQNINEILKDMDDYLVNLSRDSSDNKNRMFVEKALTKIKRLLDRNLNFYRENSSLLSEFSN
jgi:hypothetical protein